MISAAEPGKKDAGGRIVGECFDDSQKEEVSLAWTWAWQESSNVETSECITLTDDYSEEDYANEIEEALKKSIGKKSKYERTTKPNKKKRELQKSI